jgi:Zn-dependent protease/CBS domain-containing protein
MKWSVKLGRIAGIDVYLHATFLILLAFLGISQFLATQDLRATLIQLAYLISLFGCVLLHEFGHALVARRFNVVTRDITLLPIGGLARMESIPRQWWQELLIAIAGPAVNVIIALGLAVVIFLRQGLPSLPEFQPGITLGLKELMLINAMLVGFNLLPAFPMDGGRVLRSLLAAVLPYAQATRIAANVGQGMALLFAFAGLFIWRNPILLFIALFVWIGASQEATMAEAQSALAGVRVRQIMQTDFRTLSDHATLSDAIQLVMAGSQHDFPVVDRGRVLGILTRQQLVLALSQGGPETPVTGVMDRNFVALKPDELVADAMTQDGGKIRGTIPVIANGELIGLFTTENLAEFLMFHQAMERHHA